MIQEVIITECKRLDGGLQEIFYKDGRKDLQRREKLGTVLKDWKWQRRGKGF